MKTLFLKLDEEVSHLFVEGWNGFQCEVLSAFLGNFTLTETRFSRVIAELFQELASSSNTKYFETIHKILNHVQYILGLCVVGEIFILSADRAKEILRKLKLITNDPAIH